MDLSKVKSITWMLEEKEWIGLDGRCELDGDLQDIKDALINDLYTLKSEYPTSVSNEKIDDIKKILNTKNSLEELSIYICRLYHKGRNYKPSRSSVLV